MKRLFWLCLCCWILSIAMNSMGDAQDVTLAEREALIENVHTILFGDDTKKKQEFFGGGLYADRERVVFMRLLLNDDPQSRFKSIRYVERYEFASQKLERMVPYEFWQTVPYPRGRTWDSPIQMALCKKENGAVLIEMDYIQGTWKEIGFWPIEHEPRDVQQVPKSSSLAFTYPQNGFEHNNPDLFGLDLIDIKTGEQRNILSQIKRQNAIYSSMGNDLPFLFLNGNTFLYSETLNPYRFEDDDGNPLGDRFLEQFKTNPPYNVLWRMNIASGEKIQLATCELQMRSELGRQHGSIIWNRIKIGSVFDILQKKK